MKTILFRADSSSTIGTGHIMRDLVLASQYPDATILFATQDLEGNINHKITEAGYKVEILDSHEIEELQKLIETYKIDMVVIDHYSIDHHYEKALKECFPTLTILSFDDTYEKHHCDILFNHNISAEEDKYKGLVPEFCELRCGNAYTLLREEFYSEKKIEREKIYDVFIAMGGADTANLNIDILEALPQECKVALVTTQANKNLIELQKYVDNRKDISLFINSSEMAKLINQSRLAIVTPSVTVNEVLFLGVPFIAIKTAENQKDIFEYLQKENYNVLDTFNLNTFTKKIEKTIKNTELINFIDLSTDEKKMVLEWRNNEDIRKWMFTQELISLEEHLNYIDSLSSRDDRKYFLVKNNNNSIGVIDFTSINYQYSRAEIGLYAKPTLKGVGKLLMQEMIEYAFNNLKLNTLISEVFDNNNAAIKLYKKMNFKEIGRRENTIVMELQNENR